MYTTQSRYVGRVHPVPFVRAAAVNRRYSPVLLKLARQQYSFQKVSVRLFGATCAVVAEALQAALVTAPLGNETVCGPHAQSITTDTSAKPVRTVAILYARSAGHVATFHVDQCTF